MNPQLRTALVTAAACVAAVVLAWQIAEGGLFSFDAAGVIATGALVLAGGAILVRLFRLPLDVILLGLVLIGYLVGNRGFAQLMPVPGVPLLPAEAALGLALTWRLVVWSKDRRLPFRADAMNLAVLAWLVAGSARLVFDTRHGFNAIRDYATVYYALFFFLAQGMAQAAPARRYLAGCLLTGLLVMPPVLALYQLFPRFFMQDLTLRGTPLVYFKGDLTGTFLGVGALLVFFAARGRWRPLGWCVSGGLFLLVMGGDNRASMVALAGVVALLVAARRWQFPAWQGAVTAVALTAVVLLAAVFDNDWAGRKLHGASDRLRSMVDVQGLSRYQSEESFNKGDNNRFRLVWWKNVVEDTWSRNPVFGLGFGADLAQGFLQEYYPDADEEFNTRSPHNIFITVFGRMGLVGLAVWGWFSVVLAARTWGALRAQTEDGVYWCAACLLFGSACFGVVLEGPMGAVVFWVLLGLAQSGGDGGRGEPARGPAGP